MKLRRTKQSVPVFWATLYIKDQLLTYFIFVCRRFKSTQTVADKNPQ